ncbi:hypothetical protein ACHAXH_006060 [Discostella pseudostelligera]
MPTKIKSDDDRKSFRYSFLSSALPSNSFIVVVVVIVVDRLLEGKEEREIETLVSMASTSLPLLVELKSGTTYNGRLQSCDTYMNINLREVVCTSKDGDRFWKLNECYIRGSSIKYLRLPEEAVERVVEEEGGRQWHGSSAIGRGGSGRGGREGGGRGRGGRGGAGGGGRGGRGSGGGRMGGRGGRGGGRDNGGGRGRRS